MTQTSLVDLFARMLETLHHARVTRIRVDLIPSYSQRKITLDIDSLPIEVHGQQEGSEYNGHYHATIYHPLVANIAETGDLIDTQLRHGKAHTAEGVLDFILPLLDLAEREICQVASVRIDAGFPSEPLMAGPPPGRSTSAARANP